MNELEPLTRSDDVYDEIVTEEVSIDREYTARVKSVNGTMSTLHAEYVEPVVDRKSKRPFSSYQEFADEADLVSPDDIRSRVEHLEFETETFVELESPELTENIYGRFSDKNGWNHTGFTPILSLRSRDNKSVILRFNSETVIVEDDEFSIEMNRCNKEDIASERKHEQIQALLHTGRKRSYCRVADVLGNGRQVAVSVEFGGESVRFVFDNPECIDSDFWNIVESVGDEFHPRSIVGEKLAIGYVPALEDWNLGHVLSYQDGWVLYEPPS